MREEAAALTDHVVIAGFGRVGQTVAKVLAAAGVPYVALDLDARRIARARAKGLPVFYGDASRVDVLAAAGAGRARAAVLTIDQPPAIDRAVAALHGHFPELRIFVRGHDPDHGRRLTEWGATAVVPEAVEASLQLGAIVLAATGTIAARRPRASSTSSAATTMPGWTRSSAKAPDPGHWFSPRNDEAVPRPFPCEA